MRRWRRTSLTRVKSSSGGGTSETNTFSLHHGGRCTTRRKPGTMYATRSMETPRISFSLSLSVCNNKDNNSPLQGQSHRQKRKGHPSGLAGRSLLLYGLPANRKDFPLYSTPTPTLVLLNAAAMVSLGSCVCNRSVCFTRRRDQFSLRGSSFTHLQAITYNTQTLLMRCVWCPVQVQSPVVMVKREYHGFALNCCSIQSNSTSSSISAINTSSSPSS